MIKNLISFVVLTFVISTSNFVKAKCSQLKNITLATIDYPPFYGPKLLDYGPVTEIIVEAFKEECIKVEIKFLPWVRALKSIEAGEMVDGMYSVWFSEKRNKFAIYSDPLLGNKIGFYALKNKNIVFKSYQDLKKRNYTVGIVRGFINPKGFDEAKLKIQKVTSDIQNIQKLLEGRIDLALIDKDLGRAAALLKVPKKWNQIDWITTLEVKPDHVIFSRKRKGSKELAEKFNSGLKKLKAVTLFKQILKKHGFD